MLVLLIKSTYKPEGAIAVKKYEVIFIARQDMSPAQVESLSDRFIKVLKDNGASVGKTEYCGLRQLAYLIKKNSKGHYVLMNVTASPDALKEMERLMSINEDILRFLSVVVDEHEEEASVLLKASRYKDDAPERGNRDRSSSYGSRRPYPRNSDSSGSDNTAVTSSVATE
jgi:small subunit ribosomal protein S6